VGLCLYTFCVVYTLFARLDDKQQLGQLVEKRNQIVNATRARLQGYIFNIHGHRKSWTPQRENDLKDMGYSMA